MTTKELVQEFLKLQNIYSFTRRTLVTADKYVPLVKSGAIHKKDYENHAVRESLMEHVGHLPILASFFHPHIQHSKDVNLGRALIMLSIHDIGETVTGEIFAYSKTEKDSQSEYLEALKVLHPDLQAYYEEFELNETLDAKYAKSIDILAPNIHQVDMPRITIEHFKSMGATRDDVIRKKRPFMEWDPVMLEVFDLLMEQYKAVENQEDFVFAPEDYDIL